MLPGIRIRTRIRYKRRYCFANLNWLRYNIRTRPFRVRYGVRYKYRNRNNLRTVLWPTFDHYLIHLLKIEGWNARYAYQNFKTIMASYQI